MPRESQLSSKGVGRGVQILTVRLSCASASRGGSVSRGSGLAADLRAEPPTSHLALLSHRAAVRRVAAAMKQMDQKKHEKFANQFNYALQ